MGDALTALWQSLPKKERYRSFGRWVVIEMGHSEIEGSNETIPYVQFHTFFRARDARALAQKHGWPMRRAALRRPF